MRAAPEQRPAANGSGKHSLRQVVIGVFAGIGALVGGGLLLIAGLRQHEALYEGHPSYYWVEQLQSTNAPVHDHAQSVLDQTIIPHLTQAMVEDTQDSRLRMGLVRLLNLLPQVEIDFRNTEERRADDVYALGEFGPAAKTAAPALLRALQGTDFAVRPNAARALARIQASPEVVIPLLVEYLGDPSMAEAAALALGDYGPPAKGAVPKLREFTKAREKELRHAANEALLRIEPVPAPKTIAP